VACEQSGTHHVELLPIDHGGKRNLPSDVSLRLTRHLGLTRKETLYFEYMVAYVQSKTGFEKKEYLSRMADLNPGRRKKKR